MVCFAKGHIPIWADQILSGCYEEDIPQREQPLATNHLPAGYATVLEGTSNTLQYFTIAFIKTLDYFSTSGRVAWGLERRISSSCITWTDKSSRQSVINKSSQKSPAVRWCSLRRQRADPESEVWILTFSLDANRRLFALRCNAVQKALASDRSLKPEISTIFLWAMISAGSSAAPVAAEIKNFWSTAADDKNCKSRGGNPPLEMVVAFVSHILSTIFELDWRYECLWWQNLALIRLHSSKKQCPVHLYVWKSDGHAVVDWVCNKHVFVKRYRSNLSSILRVFIADWTVCDCGVTFGRALQHWPTNLF